jgi:hypothetical protein
MQNAKITMNGVELEVPSFVPELTGQLAIVHLSVLQRLAALLPKASLETIKTRIANDIYRCPNIEAIITVLENELAFQTSVNQIRLYSPNDVTAIDDICD